jgi:hypothetical protein
MQTDKSALTRSPFPGMNPYLENPELWSEVYSRLIMAIDYTQPAQPLLNAEDTDWATERIR